MTIINEQNPELVNPIKRIKLNKQIKIFNTLSKQYSNDPIRISIDNITNEHIHISSFKLNKTTTPKTFRYQSIDEVSNIINNVIKQIRDLI